MNSGTLIYFEKNRNKTVIVKLYHIFNSVLNYFNSAKFYQDLEKHFKTTKAMKIKSKNMKFS